MMDNIDKSKLDQWKQTFARDGITYDTDEEYSDAVNNLLSFFKILYEIDQQSNTHNATGGDNEIFVYDKDGSKIIL